MSSLKNGINITIQVVLTQQTQNVPLTFTYGSHLVIFWEPKKNVLGTYAYWECQGNILQTGNVLFTQRKLSWLSNRKCQEVCSGNQKLCFPECFGNRKWLACMTNSKRTISRLEPCSSEETALCCSQLFIENTASNSLWIPVK